MYVNDKFQGCREKMTELWILSDCCTFSIKKFEIKKYILKEIKLLGYICS